MLLVRVSMVLTACALAACPSLAQELTKAQIAQKVKQATCLVELNGSFRQGSAFCLHESGLFLTNEHVIRGAGVVKLVMHPGTKNQKSIAAQVIRVDRQVDLALLRVKEKGSFAALSLGSSDGLTELMEVIAAGFPFGKALALEEGAYPTVSVSAGRITALRTKNGNLERIQMDAVVQPGNSGGPVLDSKGKVIGVVVEGIVGANINYAIPVSHVQRFAATPELDVTAPAVAYGDRFKKAEFKVRTLELLPRQQAYELELVFPSGGGDPRTYKMLREKGIYRAIAEPALPSRGVRVSLAYSDGNLQAVVPDRTFKIGDQELKLSEVQKLTFTPKTSARRGEQTFSGDLSGLGELPVSVGTDSWTLDPRKAREMVMYPAADDSKVPFVVIARSGDKEIGRAENLLLFDGAPGIDAARAATKLEGLWVLDSAKQNGGDWPIRNDEAILIEGKKLRWVKSNGKPYPFAGHEARIVVEPTKTVTNLDIILAQASGEHAKWLAICKVEDNLLTIATNCNDERRPALFTTSLTAGPQRATFVRVYKREPLKRP